MEVEGSPRGERERAVLAVDTRAASAPTAHGTSPQAAASSPLSSDARVAGSAGLELPRKGSNEWASPRSLRRRGTPPPAPRRASRSAEDMEAMAAGTELPPRPRTPAQVLANRAAAAKISSSPSGTAASSLVGETPQSPDAASGDTMKEGGAVSGPEGREGDSTASDSVKEQVADVVDSPDGEASRRGSIQLSAVGSEQFYAPDVEDDGEPYMRGDRVDTSTVGEESVYNDEDDVEESEDESPGTSDEYVNIYGGSGVEYHLQQFYDDGDDSLTPDNTPPPSPPRRNHEHHHHQQHEPQPPLATSEWVKYVAESGHEYYFNLHTNVSQWTRPRELVSPRNGANTDEEKEEDGPEEENQSTHSELGSPPTPQLLPQLQVQVPPSQLYQPQLPNQALARAPLASTIQENLFAAAARSDETAQLEAILRYDVDVNAVSSSGLTPLHVAVQHGNARGAAMLLDYGALVDGPIDDTVGGGMFACARLIETPLVMACRTNYASLVRLLIRYGASLYTRDKDGNCVLHIAIRCWSDEVLSVLLEMDSVAAVLNLRNADEETPLHLAARYGNANAVKALLTSGVSTDVEDAQGRTPLVVSIMENRVDCAQLLQEAVARTESFGDAAIPDSGGGPSLYDSSMNTEGDSEGQGRDELDGLRIYLSQLVQHATTDGVLLSTIYQYMDAVQREIKSLMSVNAESREREENLLSQIDQLTNHESLTASELIKEREESDALRQQLEAKDGELNAMQAAYESLYSRSTMLESIARSSQDKLRRERVEFARQEEYWNRTIDNSLRENAALLETVQSLQQGRRVATALREPEAATTTKAAVGHEGLASTGQQQGDYGGYALSAGYDAYKAYYASETYSEAYDTTQHGYNDVSQQDAINQDPSESNVTAASTPAPKSECGRPISPQRVDAVWNRFFENMSRAEDPSPPPRDRSTLSPRHHTAQVSMLPPASAVFDSVRKNRKDRLHQLLLSGISPNVRDLGEKGSPLHLAAELGDLDAVMLLSEFGADLEIRDESGNTPLLVACSQGHYDCTKFLLQSAANLAATNAVRDTALHLAAWDGSFECVEILLEYGVDVVARNSLGLTALANVKTRSPLRHRFEDLVSDHPMAKTLALLDEAERFERDEGGEGTQVTAAFTSTKAATKKLEGGKAVSDTKPPTSTTSWGRWILGSVFGSYFKAPTPLLEAARMSEERDDDTRSDSEETESSPPRLPTLRDYEELRPPPEIEAELRRKSLSSESSSLSLPPPPPEVLEALEKRTLSRGVASALLSPSHTATRFASPASMPPAKKFVPSAATNVRSRYVDTFNTP